MTGAGDARLDRVDQVHLLQLLQLQAHHESAVHQCRHVRLWPARQCAKCAVPPLGGVEGHSFGRRVDRKLRFDHHGGGVSVPGLCGFEENEDWVVTDFLIFKEGRK